MNTATLIATLKKNQAALYVIILLELTGYLYPPPALLRPDSFDYIIVGGGTAGSVIANRLAQQKYNVLLIEAVQDAPFESIYLALLPYLKNSKADWNYTSENDKYSYQCHARNNVDLIQGKMFGGSSALNYMVYSRGNPKNYEEWYKITKDKTKI